MSLKMCKGCYEVFQYGFEGDYCEYCQSDINSGEDGWLELNRKEEKMETNKEEETKYCVECGISIFPKDVRYRIPLSSGDTPTFYRYKCKECGNLSLRVQNLLKKKIKK